MKTCRIVSVLLALLIVLWSCERDETDSLYETSLTAVSGKADLHKSKLQNRAFISDALVDNFIGNHFVRKMQVYTPPGYKKNGSKAYPVVYLLHGLPFSEKAYIDQSTWDFYVRPGELWPFQQYPDFPQEGFQKWVDKMIEDGIDTFIEIGPGKAISGFVKKINRKLTILNVEDIKSLEKTLERIKENSNV